jgi:alpha(1,3/1,4) fucosyltransferase
MAPLKIFFTDFWDGFDPYNNWFTQWLAGLVDVEINARPDLLIFSRFGKKHLQYDCFKLQFLGENLAPDFKYTDYAISFDWLNHERHLRIPLYAFYISDAQLEALCTPPSRTQALQQLKQKKGFCSFVVSNAKSKDRIRFFDMLQNYEPVASGGKALNNIGGPVDSKLDFLRTYKFNIAFENCIQPGYVTEKLIEAKIAGTIPIYCGSPNVAKELNTASFIDYHQYGSLLLLKNAVMAANENDELCLNYLQQPLFYDNQPNEFLSKKRMANFFNKIIADMGSATPISQQPAFAIKKYRLINSLLRNRTRKPFAICK